MPAILLNRNDDGTATAAPIDATPEMLQEGETFNNMGEALKAVGEIMNGDPDPEAGAEGPMSTEGQPMQDAAAQGDMEAGYQAARTGQ